MLMDSVYCWALERLLEGCYVCHFSIRVWYTNVYGMGIKKRERIATFPFI
jgi:hypothetical protein